MALRLVLIFALIACPLAFVAQQSNAQIADSINQSAHGLVPADLIDGAQHPELIPDSVAYRLYFVAVAELPNPTPDQLKRQNAYLGLIGLTDNDLKALAAALGVFKLQYTNMIAAYNETAEAAAAEGTTPDIQQFVVKREALIKATREMLKRSMTQDGLAKLHDHIMQEKKGMKVAAKEVQWITAAETQ